MLIDGTVSADAFTNEMESILHSGCHSDMSTFLEKVSFISFLIAFKKKKGLIKISYK